MNSLSTQRFWSNYWKTEQRDNDTKFVFSNIIEKYIPELTDKSNNKIKKSYMEIGCAPGNIMNTFATQYNCQVNGIDFVQNNFIKERLKQNEIEDFELIQQDFTEYVPSKKYHIVASFGFIEHFEDYNTIIRKHMDMVDEGGYLILELPNIRYFNYMVYSIFNSKLLAIHNCKIMNLELIKSVISNDSKFKIIYNNYYLSNFLMFNKDNEQLKKHKFLGKIFNTLQKLLIILHLDNIPNKFFSPYIICIAKKENS